MKAARWIALLVAAPAALLVLGCGGSVSHDTGTGGSSPQDAGAGGSSPHDGGCAVCPGDATCKDGACVCNDPAKTACLTGCFDLSDHQHCSCDVYCGGNQICAPGGGCIEDVGCIDPTLLHCGPGVCVDAQKDAQNCGTCHNVCGAGQTCMMGVCG